MIVCGIAFCVENKKTKTHPNTNFIGNFKGRKKAEKLFKVSFEPRLKNLQKERPLDSLTFAELDLAWKTKTKTHPNAKREKRLKLPTAMVV